MDMGCGRRLSVPLAVGMLMSAERPALKALNSSMPAIATFRRNDNSEEVYAKGTELGLSTYQRIMSCCRVATGKPKMLRRHKLRLGAL